MSFFDTRCINGISRVASGMPIPDFFHSLREISRHTADTDTDEKKSSQISQIWEDYLNHLAFAMKKLNLIIDAPMIFSGFSIHYDKNYLIFFSFR